MSADDIQITARRLQQIGRLVAKAANGRRAKKPWGPLPPKIRRAMQPTKQQRADFNAKFAAAYVHVQYHIQPTGDGFEVCDTTSNAVLGKFETFRRASDYVRSL